VTALILNPTTVGTVVLTSRPGRFTPGKIHRCLLSRIPVGCQNWSAWFGVKKKCLPFPNFQHRFVRNPANKLVTVCLWYWGNQGVWIDLTALFWDRQYNNDTNLINIASCLNKLKEDLFCTQCAKLLQFTSIPNFTCPVQPFVIIRSKSLQQIFVLQPSCCLSFCKYGSFRNVSLFPTICCRSEFLGLTNKGTRTPWSGGF